MLTKLIAGLVTVVAIANPLQAEPIRQEGTVVSVAGDKLTISDQGKSLSYTVPPTAQVTINGKPAKLADFQPGMKVIVRVEKEGLVLAVATVDVDKLSALDRSL